MEIEALVQVTNVSHAADQADNDPLQNVFAAAGEERVRYDAFLAGLRESRPVFAEASPLNNPAAPVERRTWECTVESRRPKTGTAGVSSKPPKLRG